MSTDTKPTTLLLENGNLVFADSSAAGKHDNWRLVRTGDHSADARSQCCRAFVESHAPRRGPPIRVASIDCRRRVRLGPHAGRGRDSSDYRAAERVVASWRCRCGLCLREQRKGAAAGQRGSSCDASVRGRERRSRRRCHSAAAAAVAGQSKARAALPPDRIRISDWIGAWICSGDARPARCRGARNKSTSTCAVTSASTGTAARGNRRASAGAKGRVADTGAVVSGLRCDCRLATVARRLSSAGPRGDGVAVERRSPARG